MSDADGEVGRFGDDLVMALRFFSRLPTGRRPHTLPNLDRIAAVLPAASLIIGILPATLFFLAIVSGLPLLFAALVAIAAYAMVTGAMSEDAIADAADGLFGGSTPERRLEILKDSRHGTYGVLAIVFLIGLKAAALSAMAESTAIGAAAAWLGATVIGRSGALYLAFALPPARATGAAASAGRVSRNAFASGLVVAAVVALVLAGPFVGFFALLSCLVMGMLVALGWSSLCKRLVGGQTGDLIGALQAMLEITTLACFMLTIAR